MADMPNPFEFAIPQVAEQAVASPVITPDTVDAAAEYVDLDQIDCIGEIFVGARKLEDRRFVLDVERFMLDIELPPLFLRATG